MDEATHECMTVFGESRPAPQAESPMPSLSDAERDFWRRAVAIERARQKYGRPAPFPFQDY